MAIDTAEKRRSISGIPRGIPGVTPNAAPGQTWRQESGYSYSGILAGVPVLNNLPIIRDALRFARLILDRLRFAHD